MKLVTQKDLDDVKEADEILHSSRLSSRLDGPEFFALNRILNIVPDYLELAYREMEKQEEIIGIVSEAMRKKELY